ncbi:carboxypeptidase-like regulatory domain-containing protein [Novosphingobium cyanobacteriorum]|uniref:Carboxypeptidase-like regulatory domain-containing protein n=1 Tax=Novosphingobium cyanobacteriorum TaxID=3024215 RepID=A0ABT6CL13_9SPHN|nr:carboxypeptidase-like regulatory domain-containing protein [Novosphingobium cyanobacteriorum]MDF8334615.1 carboxypeptidase-like regulatory domain-containing protein [Novosphingobium cyanobacteriorum]
MLDEKHSLSINLREGVLVHDGKELALSPRDAAAFDGELYLRAERFADLMPLTLKVDLRAQNVTITTLTPFPFEQRAAREEARSRLNARKDNREKPRFAREPTPYRAITVPVGELELRGVSDQSFGARVEADIRLAGDLAFLTARAFASVSSQEGLTAARLELGRRDPDAGLLGPLQATDFQIGDVSTTALPIGLRGVGGRGAFVTNAALDGLSVFDRLDLRGDLPAGYEAELYRNNTLIGSTRTAVNGRYEFLQVPLELGLNVFRLVLYGPQGQRREEVRRISVGDGALPKGKLVYTLGMAQKDTPLFDVRGRNFAPAQDFGALRGTADVRYGLATALTVQAAGAWYRSNGQAHWQASVGQRTSIAGIAARIDGAVQGTKGMPETARAVVGALGGRTAGIDWTATHGEYAGGFMDEVRAFTSDPLRRVTEIEAAGAIRLGGGDFTMPMAARWRQIAFANGRRQTDGSLRTSLLVAPLLISNSLTLGRSSAPGAEAVTNLGGTFDLTSVTGSRVQMRASLDYGLRPGAQFQSASAEVARSFGPDTLVKAQAARLFVSGQTQFGLSVAHRFRNLSLAFDGTMTVPGNAYAAVLRLGFSFGRNPANGRLFLDRPGLAGGGAIAMRAFRDANGNGRFDQGEDPLPKVAFGNGVLSAETDDAGMALIGGLGDGVRTSLRIEADSLPDVAMAPARQGVEIVPRAGRIHLSDFAVDMLGDVEGTATFGTGARAVTGLALELVDDAGRTIARTRTGSGGSFWFEQLHPGAYRLRLDPGQARRLAIRLEQEPEIRVDARGGETRVVLRVQSTAMP